MRILEHFLFPAQLFGGGGYGVASDVDVPFGPMTFDLFFCLYLLAKIALFYLNIADMLWTNLAHTNTKWPISAIINFIMPNIWQTMPDNYTITINQNVRFHGGIWPEQFQLDQIQNDWLCGKPCEYS